METTTFRCPLLSDMIIDTSTGDGCQDYTYRLHENYTYYDGHRLVITGTSLGCSDGSYVTLCNDGTNDPSSANVLCAEYGYKGQLTDI